MNSDNIRGVKKSLLVAVGGIIVSYGFYLAFNVDSNVIFLKSKYFNFIGVPIAGVASMMCRIFLVSEKKVTIDKIRKIFFLLLCLIYFLSVYIFVFKT